MGVKITDLGPASVPLTGAELLEMVQDGFSRKATVAQIADAVSGINASFVVMSPNAGLVNERVLTAGANVTIVDNGPDDTVVVAVDSNAVLDTLVVTDSEATDLADVGNAVNIGSADPANEPHLAVDPTSVQAKANGTTAAATSVGRLGGNTLLGPQSGIGAVLAYNDGLVRLATLGSGQVSLRSNASTDAETRLLEFAHQDGTRRGLVGYHASLGGGSLLTLRNQINGGDVSLVGFSTGGVARDLVACDPDGSVTISYAGSPRLLTQAGGLVSLRSNGSTDAENRLLQFEHSDGTRRAFIGQDGSSRIVLRNEIHGGDVILQAEDAGGTVREIFFGDPDGFSALSNSGVRKLATDASGVFVAGNTATPLPALLNTYIGGYTQSFGEVGWQVGAVSALTDAVVLVSYNHGRPVSLLGEDAGGTMRNIFVGDPDGGATMYYAGDDVWATLGNGIVGLRSIGTTDSEARYISLDHSDGTIRGLLGFNFSGDLFVDNRVHGGAVRLAGETSGGAFSNILFGDPDGAVTLYNVGAAVANTSNAPNGGFFVNNTLSGGGFERVLTASDFLRNYGQAALNRNTTTTRAIDSVFTVTAPVTGFYSVEVVIPWNTLGAGGISIEVQFSGTASGNLMYVDDDGNAGRFGVGTGGTYSYVGANSSGFVVFRGYVDVTAVGEFRVLWAQQASNGTNTTREIGAHTRLNYLGAT